MCIFGGDPPRDNSAEIARREEEARQRRIKEGRTAIDDAFSAFDDSYYDQYLDDYTGYYYPRVEDQYSDANEKLKLRLASTGNLTSSSGIDTLRDLTEYYNDQRTTIANQGLAKVNELKGNVEATRSDLYAQNRAAADPGNAAESAARQIGVLQTPPETSPLGDVFANFFANLNNYQVASQTRPRRDTSGTSINLSPSGSSGRLVT